MAPVSDRGLLDVHGRAGCPADLCHCEADLTAPQRESSPIVRATPLEYQASLIGACILFLGLGAIAAPYLQVVSELLILVGIVAHGWGMFRIRRRNR
jgi:hypothetical protein